MAGGSGIAAGASAGAAFGPWGAAIGGVLGGVSDIAGGGGGGGPFLGGEAGSAAHGNRLDGSGWSVNFGSGTQIATPSKTDYSSEGLPSPAGLVTSGGVSPVLLIGAAGVLLLIVLLKRKRG